MPIVGSLPNNLTNGTTGDASQVMANSNTIVSGVNSNANPLGTMTAPSGTRMVFHNASAPTGWTIDNTVTDHGLWVSQANGGSNQGAKTAYSSFLTGGWSPGATTLNASHLPPHTHNVGVTFVSPPSGQLGEYNFLGNGAALFTSDSGTGGGGSHSHTNNTSWNYIACVVASKN